MTSHRHNDELSFELCIDRKDFIVDPGTYVYATSLEWRNKFRGGSYHNSIVVDHKEMNEFDNKELFKMKFNALPKINKWFTSEEYDFLDAKHTGYKRIGIVHTRQILFNKTERYWLITDILTGKGSHKFDLYLHLAPEINAKKLEDNVIRCTNNVLIVSLDKDTNVSIEDGWVSKSYGKKVDAQVMIYQKVCKVPVTFMTLIYPSKNKKEDIKTIKDKALSFWNKIETSS